MGENTKIEWATHTFNPWIGCTKVAPGCTHCYAESLAKRTGSAVWGQAGTRVKTSPANWAKPLKWNREAEKAGVRQRVFCASLADVFEDWQGPIHDHRGEVFWITPEGQPIATTDERAATSELPAQGCRQMSLDDLRRDLFALIDATPHLDWLLLTKRPENIRRMLVPHSLENVPGHVSQNEGDGKVIIKRHNLWLGTSISDQATTDRNVPELLKCRDLAPVLFLSAEPLLGPIEFSNVTRRSDCVAQLGKPAMAGIDWVIVGGESGHGARPMNPAWARGLRAQCIRAEVPFLFKQWGEWEPGFSCGGWPITGDNSGTRIDVPDDLLVGKTSGRVHCWEAIDREGDFVGSLRVGKAAAGRLLDGRTWDELPSDREVTSAS